MKGDEVLEASSIVDEIKQSKPFPSKSQEAYVALLRTADDSKRFVTQVLEPSGVTLQQYNVLRILRGAGEGGLPTLTVAERMVERTPGVTRLIDRMEKLQLDIVDQVEAGVDYRDLHVTTHRLLAEVLVEAELASGDADGLLEMGVTSAFFPHGLGHLLGIQVHDVGGHQANESGEIIDPPSGHPFLRLTRVLEEDMVLTIPRGSRDDMEAVVTVVDEVHAPFDQGEALGELKVTLSDGKEILVPLVALNGVQEAGFFAALWDTIMLFFLKLTGGDPLAL